MKHFVDAMELAIMPVVTALFAAVTIIDTVDIIVRIASGTAAVVVAYYAVKSYRARTALDKAHLKKLRNEND